MTLLPMRFLMATPGEGGFSNSNYRQRVVPPLVPKLRSGPLQEVPTFRPRAKQWLQKYKRKKNPGFQEDIVSGPMAGADSSI